MCFDNIKFNSRMSASNAATQKRIYESGMTTLIISNVEMEDIIEILKYLEDSGLLKKYVSKTFEQKGQTNNKVDLTVYYLVH